MLFVHGGYSVSWVSLGIVQPSGPQPIRVDERVTVQTSVYQLEQLWNFI